MQSPPWIERMLEYVRDHGELSAGICFLLGFGESLVLVSLFVPSTALFLGIGAAQSAAGGAFWPLWLAGSVGAFAGDVLSYAIGRRYKRNIEQVWPFNKYSSLIPKSQVVFERWGWLSIVGGKFVGGLRPFLPVAAGMVQMPWSTFLASSAASCLLWAGVFLAPGFGLTALMK